MGKAIAISVVVAGVMAGIGVFVAFATMLALNGFSEREGARIMMVIAAGYFAVMFLVVSKTAKALLPEADKPKAKVIGGVLTALPALPLFGFMLFLLAQ